MEVGSLMIKCKGNLRGKFPAEKFDDKLLDSLFHDTVLVYVDLQTSRRGSGTP